HAVFAQPQLQLVRVALQGDVPLGIVAQADVHVAVAQLDVHGFYLLGGEGGALHRAALALLKEEAAPVLAVAHGKAPVPGLPVLTALLGLLAYPLGVLAVAVVVLDK